MRGIGNIYIGGWWRYRWWKGQCGSAYWLNVYVRIRAPRDGRAQGLCGTFRGNRNTDENYLIQKRGQRRHHQIARKTRDENMVAAKDSFFFCGAWKPGFRYVDIDLTVWMREWVTSSEHNYGIMIVPTGFDGVGFVSYLDPDANQRPRLSLSCHGDNFDTTHSASNKFVFRETRSKLVSERKKKVTKAQKTR